MIEVQEDAEDNDWHAQDAQSAAQILLKSRNVRLWITEAQDTRSREKRTRIMHPSNLTSF